MTHILYNTSLPFNVRKRFQLIVSPLEDAEGNRNRRLMLAIFYAVMRSVVYRCFLSGCRKTDLGVFFYLG